MELTSEEAGGADDDDAEKSAVAPVPARRAAMALARAMASAASIAKYYIFSIFCGGSTCSKYDVSV